MNFDHHQLSTHLLFLIALTIFAINGVIAQTGGGGW